jgi:hypothetical protein
LVVGRRSSIISHQPSVVSHQPSAISPVARDERIVPGFGTESQIDLRPGPSLPVSGELVV